MMQLQSDRDFKNAGSTNQTFIAFNAQEVSFQIYQLNPRSRRLSFILLHAKLKDPLNLINELNQKMILHLH